MKIGIDIDDVLADFIPQFRLVSHEMYGKPSLDVEPNDWAWSNFGLTAEEIADVWAELRNTKNWHLSLYPLDDTWKVRELDRAGHELYYITARFKCLGEPPHIQTAQWLDAVYGVQYPTVIVAKDKTEIIKALNLDYFIDDRAETCEAVAKEVPTCIVAVKDREHNRHCDPAIWRVKNFNEFADRILRGGQ